MARRAQHQGRHALDRLVERAARSFLPRSVAARPDPSRAASAPTTQDANEVSRVRHRRADAPPAATLGSRRREHGREPACEAADLSGLELRRTRLSPRALEAALGVRRATPRDPSLPSRDSRGGRESRGRKQKRRASRRTPPSREAGASSSRPRTEARARSARAFFSVASSARSALFAPRAERARAARRARRDVRPERRALLLRAGQRVWSAASRAAPARATRDATASCTARSALAFGAVQERAVGGGGVTRQTETSPFSRSHLVSPAGLAGDVAQLSTAFAGFPREGGRARTCTWSRSRRSRPATPREPETAPRRKTDRARSRPPRARARALPPESLRRCVSSREGPNAIDEGALDAFCLFAFVSHARRGKGRERGREAARSRRARGRAGGESPQRLQPSPLHLLAHRVVHDRRALCVSSSRAVHGGSARRASRERVHAEPRGRRRRARRGLAHVELGMRGPLFVFAQPVAHALQRAALPFPTVGREDALQEHAGGQGVRRGSVRA